MPKPARGKAPKKAEPEDDAPPPPPPPPAMDNFDMPSREIVVPDNQLQLNEADLEEEHVNMLTANNPSASTNIVRFDSKERSYKVVAMMDNHLEIHYSADGWLLHKSSDDAKRQLDLEKLEAEAIQEFEREQLKPKGEAADGEVDDSKQLRNQFNFSERAAQTQNLPYRDRSTSTEPPPQSTFCANATQWEIFDAYMEDQERQRIQRETAKAKTKVAAGGGEEEKKEPKEKKADSGKQDVLHSTMMAKATKVLERMVNQNSFDDIAQDFKYWDDASDAFREGEGTLLPLWKFFNERAKKKHVTAMSWNPEYHDLFAVGYGSFDFMKQSSGLICCYSLKNPSHPEYTFTTESGVMCLDFHPQHSSLLAVGLYDGTVMIYDVRNKVNRPIYYSTVKNGKHTDPVWQVSWQEEDLSKSLNFFSVSSDGRVTLWTMSKSELQFQDVMELKLVASSRDADPDDDTALGSLAGGCSFDFNKASDHLFVVGTEEGRIHKCSKAYNSQYLETYKGHHMAVYSVRWNYHHPRVFLSASADWTVKLWDHNNPKPIMSFDLNNSVGDVAWAPYSSTVFAAVSSDGKVHVFDLNENKHEPMCEQKIVRKAKLTKIAFNPKHPIILVGDDRGCVTSLKMSPNLRKPSAAPPDGKTAEDVEVDKLDKIMEVALKGDAGAMEG